MKKLLTVFLILLCFLTIGACTIGSPGGSNSSGHNHDYSGDWISDDYYHWKECSVCGQADNRIAHQWDNGKIDSTQSGEGARVFTCTVCGKTKNEAVTLCKVTFYDYEGNIIDEQFVVSGESAAEPEVPEREGYRFTGWNGELENITRDTQLTAQYIQQVVVTFWDYNDVILDVQIIDIGGSAELPENPKRNRYAFVGWIGEYQNVYEDVDIYADYVRQYTVIFLDRFGDTVKEELVNEGATATPPDPEEVEGYTFIEWSEQLEDIRSDLVVMPKYEINSYSIRFVMPNGEIIKEENVLYQGSATPPEVDEYYFEWDRSSPNWKKGFTFTGWNGKYTDVSDDAEIKAVYDNEIKDPIIIVNAEEGHGISGGSVNVSIYLCGNLSLYGLDLKMGYDSELSIADESSINVNGQLGYSGKNFNRTNRTVELTFTNQRTIDVDGLYEVATITFDVSPYLDFGEYYINILSGTYFINENLEKITPVIIQGKITVM